MYHRSSCHVISITELGLIVIVPKAALQSVLVGLSSHALKAAQSRLDFPLLMLFFLHVFKREDSC